MSKHWIAITALVVVALLATINAVGGAMWNLADNMQIWWNSGGEDDG